MNYFTGGNNTHMFQDFLEFNDLGRFADPQYFKNDIVDIIYISFDTKFRVKRVLLRMACEHSSKLEKKNIDSEFWMLIVLHSIQQIQIHEGRELCIRLHMFDSYMYKIYLKFCFRLHWHIGIYYRYHP